ncbi:hypothetical protein SRB5_03250 [Streptomyces sp. RB5]|uniref:Uncharacterized protein n=1 Tax=Streptomyces smaragdinus TaxID=2585196 RepID=A0A7K0C9X2_9ACTN|nr:hypothetical protein [Streptomyces smaragdinus]
MFEDSGSSVILCGSAMSVMHERDEAVAWPVR